MKRTKELLSELYSACDIKLGELNESSGAASAVIKQLDGLNDKLDSLESEFKKQIAGKLKRIGLDDSSKASSNKVDNYIRKINSAFEDLTSITSDLANDIDDYHSK